MIHIEGEDNIIDDDENEDAIKDNITRKFLDELKKVGPFSK